MSARRRSAASADQGPPRVVIDSNVVLSALVFGKGTTARLRAAWLGGQCLPLVSTATAQGLVRVLAYRKFRLDVQEQQELLADYLPYAEAVRIPQPPPTVPLCRDPFDMPFLHQAAAGRADALVTGDADLLTLARVGRCPIMTPEAFVSGRPPSASPRPMTALPLALESAPMARVMAGVDRCLICDGVCLAKWSHPKIAHTANLGSCSDEALAAGPIRQG